MSGMDDEQGGPNVLLVVCDQMVARLAGCYGESEIPTPNLDTLCATGRRFDAAYTSYPVCVPARASLMTGRYASRVGCYDNAAAFGSDVPTIAHYLAAAGYDTALSGKMHFVGPDQLHGFQERLTTDIYPSNYTWLADRGNPKPFRHVASPDAKPIAIDYVTAGIRQWSPGLQFDTETHHQALDYLRSRRTEPGGSEQLPAEHHERRPFFLCVSYHHPHEPFHVTQDMWDDCEGLDVGAPRSGAGEVPRSVMDEWVDLMHGSAEVDLADDEARYRLWRSYAALIRYVDHQVGELLETLSHCGLRDDTAVIFTSDHGDMLGERGMVQKRVFYEPSVRIPLIVSAPGRTSAEVVNEPVSICDVLPTILDLAGAVPEAPHDGISLLDRTRDPERAIFSENHAEGVHEPCFMLRSGPYKYIAIGARQEMLFDVVNDPEERRDLAGEEDQAERLDAMRHRLGAEFDRDALDAQVAASIVRRRVVRDAMRRTGTTWDYTPVRDGSQQYWRFP